MLDDDPEWKFRIPTWVEEWLKKESIANYDTSNRGLTSSQRKGKFSKINFVSLIYLGGLNEATETG
jgi:hypothetical protein